MELEAKTLREEWRETIEKHFQAVKMRAMVKAVEAISGLSVEDVLQKFDMGAAEHKDNAKKIDSAKEFKNEMVDAVAYTALSLANGEEV